MTVETQTLAYASLVMLFILLATGLATVRYGEAFLPEPVQTLQRRHGWPGRAMPTRGLRRSAAIGLAAALLLVDLLGLVGMPVTTWLRALPGLAIQVIGLGIVLGYSTLLIVWLRRARDVP